MKKLDIEFVRKQFPGVMRHAEEGWAFCENAGGSFVAKNVIDRNLQYLSYDRVQPFARYPSSKSSGEMVDLSYETFAKAINAETDEIIFSTSTSMHTYVIANALAKRLKAGDEIIVTNQDHESNIGFWRRLAESKSIIIKEWSVSSITGELDIEKLAALLTSKTKLLCFSHCSNILGHVNPAKEAIALAHHAGAKVFLDGVAFAPHAMVDVRDLDVDFYVFSLYKTYGPHLGLLYGKKQYLRELDNQGFYFNDEFLRKRLTPAGPQYTEIVSALGIVDYYLAIYQHHFLPNKNQEDLHLHEKLQQVFKLFQAHENEICNALLTGLKQYDGVRIFGLANPATSTRFPVVSLTVQDKTSRAVTNHLIKHRIATNNGHFYAKRLLEAMGISDADDGIVRLSLVHYNTLPEVNQILNAIDSIYTLR